MFEALCLLYFFVQFAAAAAALHVDGHRLRHTQQQQQQVITQPTQTHLNEISANFSLILPFYRRAPTKTYTRRV